MCVACVILPVQYMCMLQMHMHFNLFAAQICNAMRPRLPQLVQAQRRQQLGRRRRRQQGVSATPKIKMPHPPDLIHRHGEARGGWKRVLVAAPFLVVQLF